MTDHLRASDAERHEVSVLLSRHFADGRLDRSELDERVGAAMTARTRGELASLLVDLPSFETAAPAPPARRSSHWLAVLALALALSLLLPASLLALAHGAEARPMRPGPIPARLVPSLLYPSQLHFFDPATGTRLAPIAPNGAPGARVPVAPTAPFGR